MSIKTVHNLNLIAIEMSEVLDLGDFKGLKALSHSYETLLSQLNYNHDDFEKEIVRKQVTSQIELIKYLHNNLETISIPKLLSDRNYIDVNHLTTTVARLNTILSLLSKLYVDLCGRFVPKVVIFSNSRRGEDFLWETLIKDNNEQVLSQTNDFRAHKVLTDKNSYTCVFKVSDNFRGRRYDYVYIDKELDADSIDFCQNFVKDKMHRAMF